MLFQFFGGREGGWLVVGFLLLMCCFLSKGKGREGKGTGFQNF